jgi:hypothetical protein
MRILAIVLAVIWTLSGLGIFAQGLDKSAVFLQYSGSLVAACSCLSAVFLLRRPATAGARIPARGEPAAGVTRRGNGFQERGWAGATRTEGRLRWLPA